MASEYKIHRPYVLAALPRPLDHTGGRIVAREVYGQRDGQKRKKRMELVVGVDGETASIYDIPASRLITSYPIPPQESFTCPPCSIRLRRSHSQDVYRYTYIATGDAKSQKITLFKDVVSPDGKTTSTSTSHTLSHTSPVRFLTGSSSTSAADGLGDIVAICEDGRIAYLLGEDLKLQWSAASRSAVQDAVAAPIDSFEVEYVSSGSVAEFREGIFKDRLEVFSALPRALDSDPSLIFLIVKSSSQGQTSRHIVVLAAMPGGSASVSDLQKLIPLDISPLTNDSILTKDTHVYHVDIQSGLLMELANGCLTSHDITGAVPKKKPAIHMDGAQSFARLSRPFLLSASSDSLVLYNHHYRSVHAKAGLDLSELPADCQQVRCCQLITHLRSQDLIVALIDNVLVSIHVEPPNQHGKRRKEGLLIDSIGRGTPHEVQVKKLKSDKSATPEFSRLLPGTMTEAYMAKLQSETEKADQLLLNNDLDKWEDLIRKKIGLSIQKETTDMANGSDTAERQEVKESPEWDWHRKPGSYPNVDRRWIIYAIHRVLSVELSTSDDPKPELRFILPDSNVTTYLVVAGHLTTSNLISAFRDEVRSNDADTMTLASQLIQGLSDADPSMTLLLNYLQATKLGETELLLAIRSLMLSMDLLLDTEKLSKMKLVTNDPHKEAGDDQEMDLDDLERDIALTEHYLGDESSSRSRGLTLAFTKLWRMPAIATVKALRATIQTEELLAFIYLLRVELIRGAWTSLYIDPTSFESEGNEPPPDGVITLIADLLGRCLDAVGAGGWLFNDAMSWADKAEAGDFLTALRLEVAAALEGIEEAVYLNGMVGEAVRFGRAVEKSWATRQTWNPNKPGIVPLENRESRLLPLGLKTSLMPTREKVVSGGEIVQRSSREAGYLISQKVEAYSVEKLEI
ncbi:hypothetical protein QQS21_009763 [Conoideocrella luteorostrata]|uniref:Utp8 beta-propeller domain-containing protein n=1 Tax=Conoideocrella luteorostrata TaxID=1105319 RepID=A0AAJ0CIN7_9HYPO|nr:hypothetical protein QQS21_009763 [Conoideocrella luteorostrata]